MTAQSSESGDSSSQRDIDKGRARQTATALLDGTGLKVQTLKDELVITNPSDPERGKLYVEYASGYVTWERTIYEYWGPLRGYADGDEAAGPGVGADRILEALTGQAQERGQS